MKDKRPVRKRKPARKAKSQTGPFAPVDAAIKAIRDGQMIIVVDDEDRENEGDLTIAAEKITPEAINFMARYGRGLICLPMTGERLDELDIPMMVNQNVVMTGAISDSMITIDRIDRPREIRAMNIAMSGP